MRQHIEKGLHKITLDRLLPANFEIFTDEVRRQCKCRICGEMVLKGERRLVVAFKPMQQGGLRVKNGKIFVVKEFYHPACFYDSLSIETKKSQTWLTRADRCRDCHAVLANRAHRVRVTRRDLWTYICESCVREPRWRFCRYCKLYAMRYESSPLLEVEGEPGFIDGHSACDYCTEERNCYTVKAKKRLRNMSDEDRNFWWEHHRVYARSPF